MIWKYHLPHTRKQPTTWEDVWLLPDDPAYSGDSIWLTVKSLAFLMDHCERQEDFDAFQEALLKLSDQDYLIDGGDVVVKAWHLDRAELLDWVRIWLRDKGLEAERLIEAPFADFAGTNRQARGMAAPPDARLLREDSLPTE